MASDNHVGYEERDPIRKDDSWKTFDEIMNLARTQDVRLALLSLAFRLAACNQHHLTFGRS